MTALVLNCNYNGLSVIQELGRHGVRVFALDSARSVGSFSRYARYIPCPDPMVAEERFIDKLLELGPSFDDRPVVFPTNDHWAAALAKHKADLLQYYIPCVADWPCLEVLLEKERFYEWASGKSLPVPRTWGTDDLSAIPTRGFPVAIKPRCRRWSSNEPRALEMAKRLDGLRLRVLRTRADLEHFAAAHRDMLSLLVVQEYVQGLSDCMYTVGVYANRQHAVVGLFSGRKVRGFPPDIGDCMVGQAEDVPDHLKDIAKTVCKELRYHGIAEFEFKRDAVTGEFRLIEVNPRTWSWIGITPACGISLPLLAYWDLKNNTTPSYRENRVRSGSVKWVRILDDLPNCLYKNRRAGVPQWQMKLRQWWSTLSAERLVVAEFAAHDPLPGAYAVFCRARLLLARIVRGNHGRDPVPKPMPVNT